MTPPPPSQGRDRALPLEEESSAAIPQWRRSQPLGAWWLLPAGLSVAVVVLLQGQLRGAGYAMAVTLAVAALARLLLPRAAVGGLMVRSRLLDVVTLVALAVAMAVLSATLVIR